MEKTYELKLASGKVVKWEGKNGIDAAQRFVDCHRTEAVVATREVQHGLFFGIKNIIE